MKVYDLIAILEQFDPQMEVTISSNDDPDYWRSKNLQFSLIRHYTGKTDLHIDTIIINEPAEFEL